jgi:hypothetical protein
MEIGIEIPKKKLKRELPCNPVVLLLSMHSKESNSVYNRGNCTLIFIDTLFKIVKLWHQPRCPLVDEWIKNMWYIFTIGFYSAIKKYEMSFIRK